MSRTKAVEIVDVPDNEEDEARAAILDKVMKGRQPNDLMLRCKWYYCEESLSGCSQIIGTILDSEGFPAFMFWSACDPNF